MRKSLLVASMLMSLAPLAACDPMDEDRPDRDIPRTVPPVKADREQPAPAREPDRARPVQGSGPVIEAAPAPSAPSQLLNVPPAMSPEHRPFATDIWRVGCAVEQPSWSSCALWLNSVPPNVAPPVANPPI